MSDSNPTPDPTASGEHPGTHASETPPPVDAWGSAGVDGGPATWQPQSTLPPVAPPIYVAPQGQVPPGYVAVTPLNPNASDKLIVPALLLAFFIGALGAHRFYVGKIGTAIFQLVLTCTIVGLFISGPWVLIDMIMLVVGVFRDKAGRPLIRWV